MADSKIRLAPIAGAALFLALVATGRPDWSGSLSAEEPAPKPSKLNDLLKERLATVREHSRLVKARLKSGQGTVDQMREANRMLLEAELDVCHTDKDRIKVFEASAAEARELEKMADDFYKAGQLQASAALAAKADRLQAEIALERAKVKAAALPADGKTAAQDATGPLALAQKQAAIKKATWSVAEAQVRTAAAELETIKAQLVDTLASQSYEDKRVKRFEGLAKQGAIQNELLDEQRAKRDAAKARQAQVEGHVTEGESKLIVARARAELAKLEFEEAELRAQQLKSQASPRP